MRTEGEKSSRTAITVAVIGVAGVIGAALIQRIPTSPSPQPRPIEQLRTPEQPRQQKVAIPASKQQQPTSQQPPSKQHPPAGQQQELTIIHEQNVNRPDSSWDLDVLNVGTKDYHACDAPCLDHNDCKSYVYIKPGIRGPDAYCVLKSELPIASLNQPCCVAGVVKERALVAGP